MWTNMTAWQTLTLLADGFESGQRSYSSISCTLPFSTALSFLSLVVQNYNTVNSDWCWWGTQYQRPEGCLDLRLQDREDKPPSMSQLKRLDSRHMRHWLMQCKRIQCRVRSAGNKETGIKYKCQECNIGLCDTPCFEVYHTKVHYWELTDTKMEKRNTQL